MGISDELIWTSTLPIMFCFGSISPLLSNACKLCSRNGKKLRKCWNKILEEKNAERVTCLIGHIRNADQF